MKIYLITAFTYPSLIMGSQNQLPWNYPEDLQHFRQQTLHSICIMGYRTHLSLQKPLSHRINIVINKNVHGIIHEDGFYHVNNIQKAFHYILHMFYKPDLSVFIIGGAKIYHEALQCITFDALYITKIHKEFNGDVFFPWKENESKYQMIESKTSILHPEITYEIWHPKQSSLHEWLDVLDN